MLKLQWCVKMAYFNIIEKDQILLKKDQILLKRDQNTCEGIRQNDILTKKEIISLSKPSFKLKSWFQRKIHWTPFIFSNGSGCEASDENEDGVWGEGGRHFEQSCPTRERCQILPQGKYLNTNLVN